MTYHSLAEHIVHLLDAELGRLMVLWMQNLDDEAIGVFMRRVWQSLPIELPSVEDPPLRHGGS